MFFDFMFVEESEYDEILKKWEEMLQAHEDAKVEKEQLREQRAKMPSEYAHGTDSDSEDEEDSEEEEPQLVAECSFDPSYQSEVMQAFYERFYTAQEQREDGSVTQLLSVTNDAPSVQHPLFKRIEAPEGH